MTRPALVPLSLERKWKGTSRRKTRDLLRLALLRELYGTLHASKSAFLARGNWPELEASANLEKHVLALAFSGESTMPSSLVQWSKKVSDSPLELGPSSSARKAKSDRSPYDSLPGPLIDALGRDRLQRFSRASQLSQTWELHLISQAHSLRFSFWTLLIETAVEDAERFQAHLTRALWPKGILLHTRTVGIRSDSHRWQGQWTLALERGTKIPPKLASCGKWAQVFP